MIPSIKKRVVSRKIHPPTGAQPGTLIISAEAQCPKIHAITYSPDKLHEQDVTDVASLRDLLDENTVTWIDIQGLGDEQILRAIGEAFNLHPLVLEDIVNVPHRPKVDLFEKHLFLIARMALIKESGIDREQLSIIVGKNFILTFQERYGDVFDCVRTRIRQGGPILRSSGAEYLAYTLLDAVIDGYYPIIETFGDQLEQIEEGMLTRPQPLAVQRVHAIKRELLAIRRAIWPMREVVNTLLRDENPFITKKVDVQLRDCYDHCVQIIDTIETYRELSGSLMEFYLSSVANRQNEVMKTLTMMATIFIPLSFIAGVYGMNFEHMPELHYPWAYPILLAVMATLAIVMLIGFYRKGWLSSGHTTEPKSKEAASTKFVRGS